MIDRSSSIFTISLYCQKNGIEEEEEEKMCDATGDVDAWDVGIK
jgi:hypothetical protein